MGDKVGQGFWQGRKLLYQRLGYLLYGARCKPHLFHLLGGAIVGLHAHVGELQRLCVVDIGVSKLETSAIKRWLAENNVFGIGLVSLVDVLCAAKPN